MRRWRSSTASTLIGIAMVFWVGSAGSNPTVSGSEEQRPQPAPVTTAQAELLPWPDGCWSPDGEGRCQPATASEPAAGEEEWKPEIEWEPTWQDLIRMYFRPGDVARAIRIVKCESGGNPAAVNPSSGAAGLFQHLPRYWKARAADAGFPGASPLNVEANVAASAWLVYHGGGFAHWAASADCWR
ncbi:MAG TPA: transglycosylase family protein [Acidimicrobiia bacterium]|nr:transglycosylase family protein [Acidimicrobiia bacterium]